MEHQIKTEFVKANGIEFEVHVCGSGDKFAICLHGCPEHAFSWRFQLPLFSRLGYTAWAPNLRGYGKSGRPENVEAYALEHLTDDVAGLIDASGAASTLLIGHDWGGLISWMFALQKIRPLDRFIVMNLPHPALFRRGFWKPSQLRKSWYILFFQLPVIPEWLLGRGGAKRIGESFRYMAVDKSRFPDEVVETYSAFAREPGALRSMINYYRANFNFFNGKKLTPDQVKGISTVLDTPTLMIWGEVDIALGKELTYGTEKLVKDFTIRYLPNVSHWVQQEAPETVNAMIEAWLTGNNVPEADGSFCRPNLDL
jgi:pimeloyl-ACP methyl ester carboxylesterase